jgi:hypothetical protein
MQKKCAWQGSTTSPPENVFEMCFLPANSVSAVAPREPRLPCENRTFPLCVDTNHLPHRNTFSKVTLITSTIDTVHIEGFAAIPR